MVGPMRGRGAGSAREWRLVWRGIGGCRMTGPLWDEAAEGFERRSRVEKWNSRYGQPEALLGSSGFSGAVRRQAPSG